jgi:hypothetical protein
MHYATEQYRTDATPIRVYAGLVSAYLESALAKHLDIQNILDELREQRDQAAVVIEPLERISFQQTPQRGRVSKWPTFNPIGASRNGVNSSVNGSVPLATSRKTVGVSTFAAANGRPGD